MKKKVLLLAMIVMAIVCLFAISANAAEPYTTKTVTLDDGTTCALWDADNNPLIWYIAATDAETGKKTYASIPANDSRVNFYNGWNGGDQLGSVTITVDDVSYDKSKFVVLNLYGAKITSGNRIGNEITQFDATVFENASNLEYAYLPLGTFAFNGQCFKNCTLLKYINLNELTELKTFGGQLFSGCSKLFAGQKLDLSHTKLEITGSGVFTQMTVTEIVLPATFTTIGEWTFQYCKQLEKITFLGEVTSMNTNSTFKECHALEEIIGMDELFDGEKLTTFGNYTFYYCKALKQVDGLIEDGVLTIPKGITSIGQETFRQCNAVSIVSLPTTLTFVGAGCFRESTALKLVDFNRNNNNVTFNNNSVFRDCSALKAVSLPRNTTAINNGMFANCVELEVVYLPSALETLDSNKYGDGCFDDCYKLYFTSNEFDIKPFLTDGKYDATKFEQNKPVKEEVYFFPSNLSFMGDTQNSPVFLSCTQINPVLVFPKAFSGWLSGDGDILNIGTNTSPKKVVFLGNITSFNADTRNSRQNYVSYYFMNEADKSPADIGYKNGYTSGDATEGYMFFCHGENAGYYQILRSSTYSEKKTDKDLHLKNPKLTETTFAATCIKNAIETQYCFCTVKIYEGEVAGSATGVHIYADDHDCTTSDKCTSDTECTAATEALSHDILETLVYVSFTSKGTYNYLCQNDGCTVVDIVDEEKNAIVSPKGYSTSDSGTGINGGYNVDVKALKLYEDVNGKITFGIAIANPERFASGASFFDADNKLNTAKGIQVEMSSRQYGAFDCSINGFAPEHADTLKLVITSYIIDENGEVFFFQHENNYDIEVEIGEQIFNYVTLNIAKNKTPVTNTPDAVLPTNED